MVRFNVFILAILIMLVSFKSRETPEKSLKKSFQSDCGCDSLWSMPVTNDFVRILEKTTLSNRSVWKGYKLGDGNFVLNAGKLNDSTHCLGLWKKGKVISYTCSKDVPTMLTPLYSYYLNYKKSNETDSTLFGTFNKSPGFSLWMKHNHVESAVYMPTDFPKFPFKITAKTKTQIAIHEAFHIEVMLRYWFTKKGSWPQWDIQPDRAGVQSCYSETEFVQRLIEEEQNTLSLFVEALMDNKKSEAIVLGNSFLKARETRYNLLNEKQIKLKGDVYGDCKTAEEIMEIEEGIADYASWVIMYNIGMVSRDELLQRYRAQQNDRFYLTGCMLLHASVLMNNGKASEIIKKIVTANSLDEGNLLHIFKTQLGLFSKN